MLIQILDLIICHKAGNGRMTWNETIIPIKVETSAIVISPTMCLRRNSYTTITPTTGTITPTTLFLVPTTQRYQPRSVPGHWFHSGRTKLITDCTIKLYRN